MYVQWPAWQNEPVKLFHGTTQNAANSILSSGVDLSRSEPNKDFGRGFYTTTKLSSAEIFADKRARLFGGSPAVIALEVSRIELSKLRTLAFVCGDTEAVDYWSLVHHCRYVDDFHIPGSKSKYDLVYGPVARTYRGRMDSKIWENYDQISFNTSAAIAILNSPTASVRKLL